MMRSGSAASYVAVAVISAAVSALFTWSAGDSGRALAQAQAAGANISLLTQPLSDLPGREVRISLLERVPGQASPPHQHPGHHTFGFVLEGTYEFATDHQPPRTLKAGEVFYEPPGAIHSTSRNPSATEGLKLLIFMVADQRNPSTINQ